MANPTARVEFTNFLTEPATAVLQGDKVVLEARVGLEGQWAKDTDYPVVLIIDKQPVDQDFTLQFGNAAERTARSFRLTGNVRSLQVQAEVDTAQMPPGPRDVTLLVRDANGNPLGENTTRFIVLPRAGAGGPPFNNQVIVSKNVVATNWTDDAVLSLLIKKSSKDLDFKSYKTHMDWLLCGTSDTAELDDCVNHLFQGPNPPLQNEPRQRALVNRRFLPFNDTDAYRLLKVATEAFVAVKSAVNPSTFRRCLCQNERDPVLVDDDLREMGQAINALVNLPPFPKQHFQQEYLIDLAPGMKILPYLALIRQKLRDQPLKDEIFPNMRNVVGEADAQLSRCAGLIRYKLTCPIMIELIWSYWHEQGMHAQTLYAIRDRFQNRRSGLAPDPLAAMEIGALRPLNNILWGYIQDEQHRLTITRRCYEYDHHYGITLQGKAVPPIQPADSRSKFLEAFHNLLYLGTVFFKEDDDTNRKADAFPVLNAIKEVHFLLSEGAHNQFGDLPTTSRIEMLMEQWMLARPEMREFLPSRESVAYPEDWMGPVDSMKAVQGWTNTSSLYFHDLAVFGEQILLSIRYNNWSEVFERDNAANWARIWRSEIQGYMHAYRTVTGVDLTVEPTEPRLQERKLDPGLLLGRRLEEQRRLGGAARGGMRLPASPTAGIRIPAPRQLERR